LGYFFLKTSANAINITIPLLVSTRGISIVAPQWLAKIHNVMEMCKREGSHWHGATVFQTDLGVDD
jgi:hypothetical protein